MGTALSESSAAAGAPRKLLDSAPRALKNGGVTTVGKSKKKGRILVPVDFSPSAEAVLRFAAGLAESQRAALTVLHVVHDPGDAPGSYKTKSGHLGRLEDAARDALDKFLARVSAAEPKSKILKNVEPMLVVGLPVTRILEVIQQVRPQMVVMSSQGRTGLKRLMLGSKAEQLVRLSPVPVTIVKTPGKVKEASE